MLHTRALSENHCFKQSVSLELAPAALALYYTSIIRACAATVLRFKKRRALRNYSQKHNINEQLDLTCARVVESSSQSSHSKKTLYLDYRFCWSTELATTTPHLYTEYGQDHSESLPKSLKTPFRKQPSTSVVSNGNFKLKKKHRKCVSALNGEDFAKHDAFAPTITREQHKHTSGTHKLLADILLFASRRDQHFVWICL